MEESESVKSGNVVYDDITEEDEDTLGSIYVVVADRLTISDDEELKPAAGVGITSEVNNTDEDEVIGKTCDEGVVSEDCITVLVKTVLVEEEGGRDVTMGMLKDEERSTCDEEEVLEDVNKSDVVTEDDNGIGDAEENTKVDDID